MKKLVQINSVCCGSTGKLMCEMQEAAEKAGYETTVLFGRGKKIANTNAIKFGTEISFVLDVFFTFFFNSQGTVAQFQTKKLLRQLEKIQPDIIHLHNIHGYYLNYPMLFKWFYEKYEGKIVWTLHDCWSFTGHCPYFTFVGCEKWKNECEKCPQFHDYPFSWFFDTSKLEYKKKKKMFLGQGKELDISLTVPSKWLGNLVSQSFLKKYPCHIINNWVNFETFSMRKDADIRRKYKIPEQKKIILGVANIWETRKGIDVFKKLSEIIADGYIIVLVGVNEHQKKILPSNIVGILRTDNQKELAKLYSEAYVFVNPSVEETFSLVTLEALACNTPVIVLDTSAVHEMVTNANGFVLHKNTAEEFHAAIEKIEEISRENQAIRESVLHYNKEEQIKKIFRIYEEK